MQVLVTGGSGAIGAFVAEALGEAGHDVTVFDRVAPDADDVSFVEGSVADAAAVEAGVEGADAVVHLAALLPDACAADPRRAVAVNVGGTLNAFEAALATETRVVYASSKAVLGPIVGRHGHPTYEPIGEDAPRSPTGVYGVTKAAVERLAATYRNRGLDAVGLRFASTYGPGKGAAHGELAMLPEAVRRAARGDPVRIDGADQRNDLVYYGDVARGVVRALEAADPAFGIYHVGSGEAVSVRRFAEALEALTDATVEVTGGLDYRDADEPTYARLDVSRARADLGYEPAYPVERGVADFLDRC